VLECVGELIPTPERDRRTQRYLLQGHIPVWDIVPDDTLRNAAGDVFYLDFTMFGNVSRFINHSCSPNLKVLCVLDNSRIVYYANEEIGSGVELTCDYNYHRVDHPEQVFICYCQSQQCDKALL